MQAAPLSFDDRDAAELAPLADLGVRVIDGRIEVDEALYEVLQREKAAVRREVHREMAHRRVRSRKTRSLPPADDASLTLTTASLPPTSFHVPRRPQRRRFGTLLGLCTRLREERADISTDRVAAVLRETDADLAADETVIRGLHEGA